MDENIPWIRDNLTYIQYLPEYTRAGIPTILHIIWVGDKPAPESLSGYIAKWSELMPTWRIRLWGNSDLTEEHFTKEILERIHISKSGSQKADIMKYSIIEKYGGFYVDADIKPNKSLEPLLVMDHELFLWHDAWVSWEYIACGFFASVPHHPVLQKACAILLEVELNTSDLHMKTGPYLLGRAVAETPRTEPWKKYGLLGTWFFDQYEYSLHWKLGSHMYAGMW